MGRIEFNEIYLCTMIYCWKYLHNTKNLTYETKKGKEIEQVNITMFRISQYFSIVRISPIFLY